MRRFKRLVRRLVILAVFAALIFGIGTRILKGYFPLLYEDLIEKYAVEYAIDKYLVYGVISAESGFDASADSGLARGLMQITDETAEWLSGKVGLSYHLHMVEEPAANIQMGCYYLSYLIDKYGSVETALAAYNAGGGNVDKWLKNHDYSADGKTLYKIPFGETARYVKRVGIFKKIYEKLY